MGLVKTIAVTVVTLLSVLTVQSSPVLLGFFAFAVLGVLLLIVSPFDFHTTNIVNCWGGGT